MSMSNVWAVIRREYLQRVRSKWFVASTIGVPLMMGGLMFLSVYSATRGEKASRNIAVVDRTGVLYQGLEPRLKEAGYTVHQEPWSQDVVANLSNEVTGKGLGGFLVLSDSTLRNGSATFYGRSRPTTLQGITLRSAIAHTALEHSLQGTNVDVETLLNGGSLHVDILSPGASLNSPKFIVAYVGAFFLYFVILLYSVQVMRATLEEKTSRVVEVIISSMRPWHLMLGKIVGVGGVAMTQMAVWVLSGVLAASAGIPAILASHPEAADLGMIKNALPGPGLLTLFLGFFVLGFFMFSALYAAVGAMCSTDEEAQQAQLPVTLLVVVPILFVMQVIQNPTSTLAVVLSLIPFFSPILMFARAAGNGAPGWQIALSFLLMGVALVAVAWAHNCNTGNCIRTGH